LLRLAWQDCLEFHSIFADRLYPISFFVDAGGALHLCGVEEHGNRSTGTSFLRSHQAAFACFLGFGPNLRAINLPGYLRAEEPTLVLATESLSMRSVAVGAMHVLALTDDGQVFRWGAVFQGIRVPEIPTLYARANDLKLRRVAAGGWHSAALTDEGKLYTWWDEPHIFEYSLAGKIGAEYSLPDLGLPAVGDIAGALFRPRCVEALAGMRIVSLSAGLEFTIVATDQGAAWHTPEGCACKLELAATPFSLDTPMPSAIPCTHPTLTRPTLLGRVFSFGTSRDGCLGHDGTELQLLPKEVEALRGVGVATVSVGWQHVLALTYTGGVYSWGQGRPALGHGTSFGGDTSGLVTALGEPPTQLLKRIEALRGVRVRCIAAGHSLSCAVTDEGHVYTWGRDLTGALGHMGFEDEPLPRRVQALHDNGVFAVGVAAGRNHTLVADADGAVWGFGCLNAIGAWNFPTVKAMREAEHGWTVENGVFGADDSEEMAENEEEKECFRTLCPHGISSTCLPVRIAVHGAKQFRVRRRR
jgi:alpha-tubulin suppressor-like RCC1 family protein